MYPVIHVGPAAIQSSILALIIALWAAATLAEREWKRRAAGAAGEGASGEGASDEAVWNVIALVVAVTLVAGRVVYVGQNPGVYAADPLQILSPTPSTLSLGVGAAIGVFAGFAYVQRRRLPLLPLLDALAPGLLAAAAIMALGQFLSGDAYGAPTDLPWAVFLWGQWRHPVQLYDTLAALSGLVVVERMRGSRAGWVALAALAWYSGARLLIDAFRGDVTVIAGGYRSTQVVALVVLLAALWLMRRLAVGERTTMEEKTMEERV